MEHIKTQQQYRSTNVVERVASSLEGEQSQIDFRFFPFQEKIENLMEGGE